jgi:hypothetical protein
MLVYTPFALFFITLHGIFMDFLELTYLQDATVYICVLEKLHRKYSRNWTKQKPNLLFLPKLREDPRRDGGGPGARLTTGGRDPAPSCATPW